jgi:hypothetical protein
VKNMAGNNVGNRTKSTNFFIAVIIFHSSYHFFLTQLPFMDIW